MAEDQIGFHDSTILAIGRPPYINDAVHACNCIQKLGMSTKVWPLMETYISIHAKEHFRHEELPDTIHQSLVKYYTGLGFKITAIQGKEHRREEQQDLTRKLYITPKAPLRTKLGPKLTNWTVGTRPEELAGLLGIDISGKLVASDLIRIYRNGIQDEGKILSFNYADF